MSNLLIFFIFIIFIIIAFVAHNIGGNSSKNKVCQQAYAENIDHQIAICRMWKAEIDRETNEKLGIKN